jgi:cytochrome P450
MKTTAKTYLQQYDAIPEGDEDRNKIVGGWIRSEWRAFFKELRESRPIFTVPGFTRVPGGVKVPGFILVTRHRDVVEVLSRPEVFSVKPYAPKMDPVVQGPFMLARDETATNWIEKSVMRTMLLPDDLPRVRALAGTIADRSLNKHAAEGRIDAVRELGRLVPLRICGEYFGFPGPDLETMYRWSRSTQADMFKNLQNDQDVHKASVQAGEEMRAYLSDLLIKARKARAEREIAEKAQPEKATPKAAAPPAATTNAGGWSADANIFDRLVNTRFAPGIPFDDARIIANMAGLLIGTGETTSQAIVQVVDHILRRPQVFKAALEAAKAEDGAKFDAIVWEALRFNPINPLLFRLCDRTTKIAAGTDREEVIPAGSIVFACTASAMFDEAAFPNPEEFNAERPRDLYLHFGYGHHLCLGNLLGGVMVPEVVKRVLLRPSVRLLPGVPGEIDFEGGPFPERFIIEYGQ